MNVYEVGETGFTTLSQITENHNSQFYFVEQKGLKPPFHNTQLISAYIAALVRGELSKHYSQYLNKNVFVVEQEELAPFQLLKSVEFNVELFTSGTYLIHALPVTKIISLEVPVDIAYINYLKETNKNNSNTKEMDFSLVNSSKFYRKRYDLLDKELIRKIEKDTSDNTEFIATFDYHFLANYSPDIFGKVNKNTKKTLKQVLISLNHYLTKIKLPDSFALDSQNYYKVEMSELDHKKNLMIGPQSTETVTINRYVPTRYGLRVEFTRDDVAKDELITNFINDEKLAEEVKRIKAPSKILAKVDYKEGWKHPYLKNVFTNADLTPYTECNKQSISYYHGIYRPVCNSTILPIVVGHSNLTIFIELFLRFNRGGKEASILPALYVDYNSDLDVSLIQKVIGDINSKLLLVIFCEYRLPNDFFEPLRLNKLKYQIYQGRIDNSDQGRKKLSNFVCKCLEKLGGITAVIKDTHMTKDGYFLGIDLGHTTVGTAKHSNLAMALFDSNGIHVADSVIKGIALQENLNSDSCEAALRSLSRKLKNYRFTQPTKLVVHRDGKLHSVDIDVLTKAITQIWGAIEVDIVEIIKSGFPVVASKNENKEAITPPSGSSFQDDAHKYAILITNSQAEDDNVVLNPLIIKHKYGKTEFGKIIDQVYWFTKVYTNNLYNSTRLPATTLKANNIVGTSAKIHRQTYLG